MWAVLGKGGLLRTGWSGLWEAWQRIGKDSRGHSKETLRCPAGPHQEGATRQQLGDRSVGAV
jgi:hypothetical protein